MNEGGCIRVLCYFGMQLRRYSWQKQNLMNVCSPFIASYAQEGVLGTYSKPEQWLVGE